VEEEDFAPQDIEAVAVHTYAIASTAVGKGVSADSTFVSAQFSLPYVVAACLTDGELGPAQLRENRISDPAVLDLAKKVEVKVDPELAKVYPGMTSSRVEIRLKSGRTLARQVDIPKGDPRDPMTAADVAAKLKRLGSQRGNEALDRVVELSLELEKVGNIKELTSII
jgi:2-methylcitrate dehydratase PrpD